MHPSMSNWAKQAMRLWIRALVRLPDTMSSSGRHACNAWSARVAHRCCDERLRVDNPTLAGPPPLQPSRASRCALHHYRVGVPSPRRVVDGQRPPVSSPPPTFHHHRAASPTTAAPGHGPKLVPPPRALHCHHTPPRLLWRLPRPHVQPSAAGQRLQSTTAMEKPLR
jgi:hypothetical protein